MKHRHLGKPLLILVLILLAPRVCFSACSQTISPGANVASVVSAAAAGTTICMNAGSYGTVTFSNIAKTADVVLQSASGRTASFGIVIRGNTNHLVFTSLTINSIDLAGTPKNLTFSNSTFSGQAVLNMAGNPNSNILIDGNTFDGISVCANCYEGRLQIIANPGISQPVGVTISNNHFGNAGESDGIQNGTYGVVIGPGNVFDGIIQGSYGRHVDAIQLYGQSHTTITGNYFLNGDTYVMAPDGGNTEIFTNNVFVGYGSYYWKLQLGNHVNDTFSHNTIIGGSSGIGVSVDAKVGSSPSANALVQNNIMINGTFKTTASDGSAACTNCNFSNNLYGSTGDKFGANAIIATPTFLGGSKPTTWAGFQLTASSIGHNAATDGKDIGTNYFGQAASSNLTAPTNLQAK